MKIVFRDPEGKYDLDAFASENESGMTKREYAWIKFAAAALTGLTNNVASRHVDDTIGDAIIYADAMLAKIERRNEGDDG